MSIFAILLALFTVAFAIAADEPTAETLMARVAANQDRAELLRQHYVYRQKIRVVSRHTNGKGGAEETTIYNAIPSAGGTKKETLQVTGRFWRKGTVIGFSAEPPTENQTIDMDLVRQFRDDLVNDQSKDGLAKDLFPLTTEEQKKYRFELAGEDNVAGRKAYRIRFGPQDKTELSWSGEALVDEEDFQPVRVYTKLSRRLPFGVRTLLGTGLPGLGFTVQYSRLKDGVWFPASFGSEFELHVLFFLNRTITISLENSEFRRAETDTEIHYDTP